jgi:glycosyltransferase involved in cell wall biosynthesis
MKVALVGPLPREVGRPVGGVQAAVEMLADSLAGQGVEVVVIDPFTGRHDGPARDWEEVRLSAMPSWRMGSSTAPLELQRAVTAANADVLHVHLGMQFCNLHAASVATVHGFPHLESKLRNPGLRGMLAAAALQRPFLKGLASAKRIISISDEVTRVALDLGVPSVRIPNPVARQFFEVQRIGGSDFVAIGDIMRRKNQRLLIEGFVGFVRAGGEGDLLIIGGIGDETYQQECQAAAEPVSDRIRFLGPKRRDEVIWFLARARASVSASLRETSSIAIAESLAANCPVVTLDVGTAREQVGTNGDHSIVLPVSATSADLTQAFLALAARPSPSRSLRSRVDAQHPDVVARETLKVYSSVAQ